LKTKVKKEIKGDFPKLFLFTLGIITFIGLITLLSATQGGGLFKRELIWCTLGWALLFAISLIDLRKIERKAIFIWGAYFLSLLLLAVVLIKGKVAHGAQRWISLGIISIQPSEFAKLILILILSKIMVTQRGTYRFKELIKPAVIVAPLFFLTVAQPDLGTAIILLAIAAAMLLLRGIEKKTFVSLILIFLFVLPFCWGHLKEYQKRRILALINPQALATTAAYHSIQSKIAIGSGKLFGKGLFQGSQSRLRFVPQKHTDFIFSVYAEETGFVGVVIFILLYALLIGLIISIASKAKDAFSFYLAGGVAAYFAVHLLINLSMTMGLLPVVGVPLPLMSYGGSSAFTTYLAAGAVVSVWRGRIG